jgi:hypothetical protein
MSECDHDRIYLAPPTGDCTKCYIEQYLADIREDARREAWKVEHGYMPGGFEVKPGVEYRIRMERCEHAACPYIREGYEHAHTLAVDDV